MQSIVALQADARDAGVVTALHVEKRTATIMTLKSWWTADDALPSLPTPLQDPTDEAICWTCNIQ
jgi:hypothetical protein